MFERVSEISDSVEAIVSMAAELRRGDTLTYERISEAIGLRPYEGRWVYILKKAVEEIERERGITCRAEITVGIRLLKQDEQLCESERRTRYGLRQVRRGHRSLQRLPVRELTVHQRRARDAKIELARQTEIQMRQSLKDQEMQMRSTPTIARYRPQVVQREATA